MREDRGRILRGDPAGAHGNRAVRRHGERRRSRSATHPLRPARFAAVLRDGGAVVRQGKSSFVIRRFQHDYPPHFVDLRTRSGDTPKVSSFAPVGLSHRRASRALSARVPCGVDSSAAEMLTSPPGNRRPGLRCRRGLLSHHCGRKAQQRRACQRGAREIGIESHVSCSDECVAISCCALTTRSARRWRVHS